MHSYSKYKVKELESIFSFMAESFIFIFRRVGVYFYIFGGVGVYNFQTPGAGVFFYTSDSAVLDKIYIYAYVCLHSLFLWPYCTANEKTMVYIGLYCLNLWSYCIVHKKTMAYICLLLWSYCTAF